MSEDRHRPTITTENDALTLEFREYGRVVDAYIKGSAAKAPLSDSEVAILESHEALPRLFQHLLGIRRSLASQIPALEVAHQVKALELSERGATEEQLQREELEYLRALSAKHRFSTGLNDAITKVEWLYSKCKPTEAFLRELLTSALDDFATVKKAVEDHRSAAIADPQGWLDREEELWTSLEELIGPSPESESA